MTHSKSLGKSSSDFWLASERDIDPALLQYLFEKNMLVFLMDSGRKVAECQQPKKLRPLAQLLALLELIIVKKAFIHNYYISQIMQHKIDIFSIEDFEALAETAPYRDLNVFFKDFNEHTRQLFHKLKTDHLAGFPRDKEEVLAVEQMDLEALNKQLGIYLNLLFKFYKKNREALSSAERQLMTQALIYLLYNKNNTTRFDFERFGMTKDWVAFCNALAEKPFQEIEQLFEGFNI